MDLLSVFEKVGLALGLGLLVGLQRERVQSPLAGIRTFALITIWGAVCTLLALDLGGWIVGAGGLAVAALLVVGNLTQTKAKEADPGLTTEIAALLMYGIGAYLMVGHAGVAIALGGATALLLHWKAPLHAFVARIGESDLRAIMQFQVDALVRAGAPIDAFGVGTKVGVSADAPYGDCAYKLVEYAGRPVLKLSPGKQTRPGPRQVFHYFEPGGRMSHDVVTRADEVPDGPGNPLLVAVMRDGKRLGLPVPLAGSRELFRSGFALLPDAHKALRGPAPYRVCCSEGLERLTQEVVAETVRRELPAGADTSR